MKTIDKTIDKRDMPLYPISIVAELIGVTDQTLRLYEKHGLITPTRRNKNRYYSENDLKWIECVRDLIHVKKISIEGIKKLLQYAPCWEITDCPEEIKNNCTAFIHHNLKPCWEFNRDVYKRKNGKGCEDCVVYISKELKKKV